MTTGERTGEHFSLSDSSQPVRIGRGMDCEVMLRDPQCSRVHAILQNDRGVWRLRDNGSLNGTFVNGRKTDEALLVDRTYVRVGNTEFVFRLSEDRPSGLREDKPGTTITTEVQTGQLYETPSYLGALEDSPATRQLLLLYQLAVRALASGDPGEVIRVALDLLGEQVRASVVGFFRMTDSGQLRPWIVLPEHHADRIRLSESLTTRVVAERRPVWLADATETGRMTDSLALMSDAICVPLVHQSHLLGAMHVYREHRIFDHDEFDFAVHVARITAVALERAYRENRLESDYHRLQDETGVFDELLGECTAMRELKTKIQRLGRTTGCVLIRGESGTGKELVARALHRASVRSDRPMLAVNCAAIPTELMESQLFGHKAGSFTGADRDHVGYFQRADGGTLFLDEAGEMNLAGQAKLLRILEGHPFMPVGSTDEISVDTRVVAATNQDLQAYVKTNRFRQDLYYRLSVFELYLPPLRDRGDDIEMLVDHFLDHFRRQHGRPKLKLSAEARQRLLKYRWPGNVRQLRNVIDSAVVLAGGNEIQPSDFALHDATTSPEETLNLEYWERKLIRQALEKTGHNIPEAAELLGVGRATLYRKVDKMKESGDL
jgi:Nif-specific regulatory protein